MTLQYKEWGKEPGNRGGLMATNRISHCFLEGSTPEAQGQQPVLGVTAQVALKPSLASLALE